MDPRIAGPGTFRARVLAWRRLACELGRCPSIRGRLARFGKPVGGPGCPRDGRSALGGFAEIAAGPHLQNPLPCRRPLASCHYGDRASPHGQLHVSCVRGRRGRAALVVGLAWVADAPLRGVAGRFVGVACELRGAGLHVVGAFAAHRMRFCSRLCSEVRSGVCVAVVGFPPRPLWHQVGEGSVHFASALGAGRATGGKTTPSHGISERALPLQVAVSETAASPVPHSGRGAERGYSCDPGLEREHPARHRCRRAVTLGVTAPASHPREGQERYDELQQSAFARGLRGALQEARSEALVCLGSSDWPGRRGGCPGRAESERRKQPFFVQQPQSGGLQKVRGPGQGLDSGREAGRAAAGGCRVGRCKPGDERSLGDRPPNSGGEEGPPPIGCCGRGSPRSCRKPLGEPDSTECASPGKPYRGGVQEEALQGAGQPGEPRAHIVCGRPRGRENRGDAQRRSF